MMETDKKCPKCGIVMQTGSPHDDTWVYQYECSGCGYIEGVSMELEAPNAGERFDRAISGCHDRTFGKYGGCRYRCYGCTPESHTLTKNEVKENVVGIRPVILEFAAVMEQKLRKNDHKSHWSKCNQEYLLKRLDDEVKELHECFFIYSPGDMNFYMDGQHGDRIPGEAADVANFAMMLWDNFSDKDE
jgi:ribosomal protein S27AE